MASPFIIAHRGSSGRAPENTLHAFRLALEEDGAQGLELDLQRTSDGEVVVLHDKTVDRTTDGNGRADQMTLEQLRRLDAGTGFTGDEDFSGRGIRVPTLREVLEQFPGVWMSLDLKQGDPLTEENAVRLLREHDAKSHVVLSAESPASAARLADSAPEFERFFDRRSARTFYWRHRLGFWAGFRPAARSLQIPTRHKSFDLARGSLIADAHRFGISVRYWTVNDPSEALELKRLGADGVITDWPSRIRHALTESEPRSPNRA